MWLGSSMANMCSSGLERSGKALFNDSSLKDQLQAHVKVVLYAAVSWYVPGLGFCRSTGCGWVPAWQACVPQA